MFTTLVHAAIYPALGIFIVKAILVMHEDTPQKIREGMDTICLAMLLLGIGKVFSSFGSKFMLGIVGENLALDFRRKLYRTYITREISWFDENSSAKINSVLSADAMIINGAGADGAAIKIETNFCQLAGIIIGLCYSWKMTLVCMAVTPFMQLASVVRARFHFGGKDGGDADDKLDV